MGLSREEEKHIFLISLLGIEIGFGEGVGLLGQGDERRDEMKEVVLYYVGLDWVVQWDLDSDVFVFMVLDVLWYDVVMFSDESTQGIGDEEVMLW